MQFTTGHFYHHSRYRHSRESGNPWMVAATLWISAYAGMT